MAEEKRSKGIDSPMCKICGHRHRFADPHQFGKAKALEVAKKAVAAPPKTKSKNGKKRRAS
jgi:hypothetical protein